jgi:Tol biopolymer transport system component
VVAIDFSPDGKQIAFFSENSIKAISIEGDRTEVLVSKVQSNRQSQLAYSPDGSRIAHCTAAKD